MKKALIIGLPVVLLLAAALWYYFQKFPGFSIISVNKEKKVIKYSFNGAQNEFAYGDKGPNMGMISGEVRGFRLEILRPQPGTLNDYIQFNLSKRGKLVSTLKTIPLNAPAT